MLNYKLTTCQCLHLLFKFIKLFFSKTKPIVYLIATVPATQTIHCHVFKIETVSLLLLLPFSDLETHRI